MASAETLRNIGRLFVQTPNLDDKMGANHANLVRLVQLELKRNGLTNIPRTADRFRISLSTLRHSFKSATGLSMRDYVNRRRLHLAALLLIRSSQQIKQIQFRCRFADPALFAHRFRRHFGISPSKFRALNTRGGRYKLGRVQVTCGCEGQSSVGMRKLLLRTF